MPRETPNRSPRRGSRPAPRRSSRGLAGPLLLGLVLGIAAAGAALWLFHRLQHPTTPPAGISEPSPSPAQSRKSPTAPRPPTQPEATSRATTDPEAAPFGISEDVFEAGARLYGSQCASCHGTPRHISSTHPAALQLWQPNRASGGTGVSRQPPARIFRDIAGGAPAAGMPAFRGVLTSTQLWQISLLLGNAGQEMPDPVLHLLDATKP